MHLLGLLLVLIGYFYFKKKTIKAIVYSIGGYEWISINLSKSTAFSLQTSENNLLHP